MPLIMLTGYPCSGLSYRAKQLAELLETTQNQVFDALENDNNTSEQSSSNANPKQDQKRFTFHIVPSHDPSHPRTVYDHARTEKEARAVAFARVKRALAKDAFVILDGMNYIKGYRYQLWCEAKAMGTTCCVVHVGTPIDKCVAINNARLRRRQSSHQDSQLPETSEAVDDLAEPDNEEPYPSDLHNNLVFRYEEPSTHSRWDKPLFTVPWTDPTPPIEEIWTATTGIAIEKNPTTSPSSSETTPPPNSLAALLHTNPNSLPPSSLSNPPPRPSDTASVAFTVRSTAPGSGGRLGRPRIQPHQATVLPAQTDPGALYGFEKRTSAIVTAIRNFTLSNPSAEAALAQQMSNSTTIRADEAGLSIPVPDASIPVFIPAHVVRSAPTDELAGAGGILTLPRLQRLRRQWISQNRTFVGIGHKQIQGALGVDQIGDAFVRYLNFEFAGDTAE
ncbi:hypothetical protein UA08_01707 [Talaromyces atroroseus]|uniref:RNA polymerase II Elongator complex associated protein Kti12 n=1 Tax=Talaromyces atroroseus TaxID=1441469 RepID=A0A1Q5QA66_TALAT|nr:hypothetical protein UA08_01707 [Talaromyces atroroseus]OKL62826.1 hypothetical protein UA08_01707 [Talaromyces atroroseus]